MKIGIIKIGSITLFLLTFILSGCDYITPEAENPTPGLENASTTGVVKDGTLSIRKSFFGIEINQETNKWKNLRKTWLCGWAPIQQSGRLGRAWAYAATPASEHCNMEFHLSEDGKTLEGKRVNVDYLNKPKIWETIVEIPVKKHYFYEKDVDSKGRQLNKYGKVERKNWQLSPFMDLDIASLVVKSKNRTQVRAGFEVSNAHDIEIESKENKNFLGFTQKKLSNRYGSEFEIDVRFNFMEFKSNPNFKKTPYNKRLAKHMNILHILGSRPDGLHEYNYAAHWDFSKPVEMCLNGFPDDGKNYKKVAVDVIEEFNRMFEKIGAVKKGQKAFVVSKKEMKHPFDLRCPSMTWINDPNLAWNAPLGIGLTNADVRNGQIIWGGLVMWGGLIDFLVNRDSESMADALSKGTNKELANLELEKNNPYYMDISQRFQLKDYSLGLGMKPFNEHPGMNQLGKASSLNGMFETVKSYQNALSTKLATMSASKDKVEVEQSSRMAVQFLKQMSQASYMNNLKGNFDQWFQKDLLPDFRTQAPKEDKYVNYILKSSKLLSTAEYTSAEKETRSALLSGSGDNSSKEKLYKSFLGKQSGIHDLDRTVQNQYDSWESLTKSLNDYEKLAAAKSVVKNVLMHELGHVTGMGHQFEGNRLPAKGTVPDSIYNYLVKESKTYHNYSSIMDYQSGRTEVSLPYNKVKLQAQDELVLTYLYTQKYSTYRPGDEKFTFFNLPQNGVIPDLTPAASGKPYQARYMDQCSDFDAWLATSPYCRRWDRGYDAPTIVEETYKEFTDNFIAKTNSFTEATGDSPSYAGYRLWGSVYTMMNSMRTFYDHMRYQMSDNTVYRKVFDKLKRNKTALLRFSKACIDPTKAPQGWENDFAKLTLVPTPEVAGSIKLVDMQKKANYSSLLNKLKGHIEGQNLQEMSDEEFNALDEKMYESGVAFTELQKLCRSNRKALSNAKELLTLKGPDHNLINYNQTQVPTGLRGGNATSDYSRVFGRYYQLGLLPVKLATLDVLTSTASTMQMGWWNVGKPKFDNEEGKFAYFPLYPEEFTDVIGAAVKNNMKFGGTLLQDTASLSISNLYMSYFLNRTFRMTNDSKVRGFDSNYVETLQDQTNFNVRIVPILLQAQTRPGQDTNKVFGFSPLMLNPANNKTIDLPEAYLLPERKIIIRGNDNQIILPMTRIRFLAASMAFVWALEVTYDATSFDDPLEGFTVKNAISKATTEELNKCMRGRAGLSSYFSGETEFKGFLVNSNIATDRGSQVRFEESVKVAFEEYKNRADMAPTQNECDESVKGVGLIGATALSLNGWILPQVFDYIKK